MERGYDKDLDLLCKEIITSGECYPRARGSYIQNLVQRGTLATNARATITIDGKRVDIIDSDGNLLGMTNRRYADYVIKKLREAMPRAEVEAHRMDESAKPVKIRYSDGLGSNL